MPRLQYLTNKGVFEEVHGSDTRLNTDALSEPASFHVSLRDGQSYVLPIEDDDAAAGDLVAYIRNDSTSKQVFIESIVVSSENSATFKVHYGDSTTATGTSITPVNLNRSSANDADVTALGNAAVGGVSASTHIASIRTVANAPSEINFNDALILGQNDNIVLEYDTGTTGDMEANIFFFLK